MAFRKLVEKKHCQTFQMVWDFPLKLKLCEVPKSIPVFFFFPFQVQKCVRNLSGHRSTVGICLPGSPYLAFTLLKLPQYHFVIYVITAF